MTRPIPYLTTCSLCSFVCIMTLSPMVPAVCKTVQENAGLTAEDCPRAYNTCVRSLQYLYISFWSCMVQGNVELGSMSSGISVSKMAAGGAGVWISFNRSANLELYHAVTRLCLQQIDVGATLNRLIASRLSAVPCAVSWGQC